MVKTPKKRKAHKEPDLTAKQEKFAQLIASGKNQTEAYKESYDASRMTDKTAWERASFEAGKDKVRARILFLKVERDKTVIKHMAYDLEAHFRELEDMRQLALVPCGEYGNINVNAAIKAAELKGKVLGMYVDRSELTGKNGEALIPPVIRILGLSVGEAPECPA